MADQSEDLLTARGLLMFLLVVLGVFGAAVWWDKMKNGGWIDVSAPEPIKRPQPVASTPQIPDCLEHVEAAKPVAGGFSIALSGVLKNNCGKALRYVQITFKIYDKKDTVIGTALANQTNLAGGESWRYSAPVLQSGVSYYRLDEVVGH